MKINADKLQWQEGEALRDWKNAGGIGVLQCCTGSGKTYIAILAIKKLNINLPNANINVVVPTTKLKDDWVNKVNGHILTHNLVNVEVFVVNSYIKKNRECVLLICDECHRFMATTFLKTIVNTKYEFLMGLTATLERLDGKHEIMKKYAPIVHTLTEEQAIQRKFIVPSVIFNLLIELNDKEKKEYGTIDNLYNQYFKYFGWDFKLAMDSASSMNPRWNDILKQWDYAPCHKFAMQNGYPVDSLQQIINTYNSNKKNQLINKNKPKKEKRIKMVDLYPNNLEHKFHPKVVNKKGILFLHYMTLRKDFVYNLQRKVDYVKEINSKFAGQIITFAQSIKIAQIIKESIPNSVEYHSGIREKDNTGNIKTLNQTPTKDKKLAIEAFENGTAKLLSTVKSLNEGFNVERAEMCIRIAQTRSKIDRVQISGRASRIDKDNPNKIGITINLCIDDFIYKGEKINSSEKKTIIENQKGKNPFWVTSVNEIIEIIEKLKGEKKIEHP
tara:strand:- start:6287 stop:7786 length:1500 start_codon:yes stop_codon:yes gene_type:complete